MDEGGSLGRGALVIVLTGVVLGLGYNQLGLISKPAWGLQWIAEDRGDVPTLEDIGSGEAQPEQDPLHVDSDDPMAFVGGGEASTASADVPNVPDLGRPIQAQLSAVKKFFDAGAALIVDAREAYEFEDGHIAGAINMPFDEVITDPALIEQLDTGGRPIITYCGGGACEQSLNLAWEMINRGHPKVLVFMGGFPEWQQAGYPVESGNGEGV